jgi:hypothetical protein
MHQRGIAPRCSLARARWRAGSRHARYVPHSTWPAAQGMTTVIHPTRAATDTATIVATRVAVTATRFLQRNAGGKLSR